MREMMAEYSRPDVQQIAIILTDGVSNIDGGRTIPEADQAKAENINIFVIGESSGFADKFRLSKYHSEVE